MKSTEIIHEIVEDFGLNAKPDLMRLCNQLREQVAYEVRKELISEIAIRQNVINSKYLALIKKYRNGRKTNKGTES